MRSRPAPKPVTWEPKRNKLAYDPQIRKWVQRLTGDPEAKPSELSEEQLLFVTSEVMKQRGEEFDSSLYQQALAKTCPVVAAPKLTNELEDLGLLLSLPEIQAFWADWGAERPASGPAPNFAGAKAHMTVMAMLGTSAHADDAHHQLRGKSWMAPMFSRLEAQSPTPGSRSGFDIPGYSTSMRHMERLAPACNPAAVETNIELMKWMRREVHPDVGKRLLIDGSAVPAWCQQYGAGRDDRRETRLRKHTPEAGFRAYYQSGSEKRDIRPDDSLKAALKNRRVKAWRGYYVVCLYDQATSLPLVWTVFDAAQDEAAALVPLLSLLHQHWPDIDAEMIAGDSAWDERWACRTCEVDYGIHPIFRQHGTVTNIALEPGQSRDGSISGITHDGRLICAQHNKPLPYASMDCPGRANLRPGESNDEGAFRLRGVCDHDRSQPQSKPGLRAAADWRRLTYFPHHPHGNPRLHAMRLAMLTRLNQAEGGFNRLKTGRKLGTAGPDRTRIRDRAAVEALVSLAFLSFTGFCVADQRLQRDGDGLRPLDEEAQPPPTSSDRLSGATGAKRPRLRVIPGGRS